MNEYLPWFAGALLLATVGLGYLLVTGLPLGASGLISRLIFWKESVAQDRSAEVMEEAPSDLEKALIAATLAQFGDRAAQMAGAGGQPGADCGEVPVAGTLRRLPLPEIVVFMTAVFAGGLLSSILKGGWSPTWTLGPEFEIYFGTGVRAAGILFLGGVLVGFGTRMAGGCTSGHGLNGCARLQPASLAATATFMAAGVGVSLLLKEVAQ